MATLAIGMSLGSQQGLHPFFEKSKRLAKYHDTSHQASSGQPAVSGDDGKLSSTAMVATAPGQQIRPASVPRDPSTHLNNDSYESLSSSATQNDGHGFLPAQSDNLSSREGKAQRGIRTEQNVQVNHADVASLDIDLNSARNKRRRLSTVQNPDLTSENQSGPWLVQLLEAAYGQPAETPSAQANLTEDLQTAGIRPTYQPSSAHGSDHRMVEDHKMVKEQEPTPNVSAPEDGTMELPSTEQLLPRKKMLTLRADGRLSSPKSRVRDGGSSEHEKSNRKENLLGKHKILVIKYGLKEESRYHMGQKLEAILSADVKGQGYVGEAAMDQLQRPKVIPSGPPKPMHPFFLGNTTAKQASGGKALIESERASTSTAGSDSEHGLDGSPRKSRILIEPQRQAVPFSKSAEPKRGLSSRELTKAFRNTGADEPAWPSQDAMHVRGLDGIRDDYSFGHVHRSKAQVKLKGSIVGVPRNEDVLLLLASQFHIGKWQEMGECSNNTDVLRVPLRKVVTGTQLKRLACREISTRPCVSQFGNEADSGHHVRAISNNAHPAVSRLFSKIPSSLTAFDQAQCEPYSWIYKYAPKRAEEVLQSGREAILLRDWLRSLTIEAIDTAGAERQPIRESSAPAKRPVRDESGRKPTRRKKRRRRAEILDGFVVSSGDEDNEMSELTGPDDANEDPIRGDGFVPKRTVVRAGDVRGSLKTSGSAPKLSNAVLISGPHGCGKTAAVYAAANELGFEVFELNPGSKRSGKDIMDKVGDMAQNHLVQRSSDREERQNGDLTETDNTPHREKVTQVRPVTNPFAKSEGIARSKLLRKREDLARGYKAENKLKQHAKPKQSLILLEEVDILFDEDRQFWATVLLLIAQSKRPIIMTCNDESLVPLEEMSLHAILRFTYAACDLATDYLLVLAANEGHLLRRSAVLALYKSKGLDIRATIAELDFWCQMAIGDKKGGLEWILERWPAPDEAVDFGQRPRVVSTETYLKGMGWFDRDSACTQGRSAKEREVELCLEAWRNWGLGTEELLKCGDTTLPSMEDATPSDGFARASLSALKEYEILADAVSATDLYGSPGLRTGHQALLDPTLPEISEKLRGSFVEGYSFIQTDLLVEHDDLSTLLALHTQALARRSRSALSQPIQDGGAMEEGFIDYIADGRGSDYASRTLTRMDLAAAFDPLAESAKKSVNTTTGLLLSEFDRSTSLLVEDLAPYVRSIIAYDLRLEQERLRLSNLLSQGGRDGKRIRTTRASRAALEGGSKAHTRRERWLPAGTNAALVLRTGGQGWQDAAAEYSVQGDGYGNGDGDEAGATTMGSRRSSLDSTTAREG